MLNGDPVLMPLKLLKLSPNLGVDILGVRAAASLRDLGVGLGASSSGGVRCSSASDSSLSTDFLVTFLFLTDEDGVETFVVVRDPPENFLGADIPAS